MDALIYVLLSQAFIVYNNHQSVFPFLFASLPSTYLNNMCVNPVQIIQTNVLAVISLGVCNARTILKWSKANANKKNRVKKLTVQTKKDQCVTPDFIFRG